MCHTAEVAVFVLLWANLTMSEHTVVAVVLASDSIVLNCTENTTKWHFTPLNHTGHNGGDKDIYMYTRSEDLLPGVDRKVFRLTGNRSVGEVNLIITNVTFEWAGEYKCWKNSKTFIHYKLIVLACRLTAVSDDRVVLCTRSKTQHECSGSCSSPQNGESLSRANNEFIGPNICNIPQDQILVSCSVTYFDKDYYPFLELRNLRDNEIIDMSCNTTLLNANKGHGRLTYRPNVTMNATLDLDGAQFIWQTNQLAQTQYNCTTEPIKILYSIDGTQSNHQTAQLHDQLNCTATCSHPCSYKWTRSERFGKGVHKYEQCTNELIANHPGFYRCDAVCQMGKHLCEVTVKNVEVSSPTVSEQVGEQANDGLKTSVSIVVVIFTIGRLLDIWHIKLI